MYSLYELNCYKNPVAGVGVDDSSTNWLGSSVAERPAMYGVVPVSIPGLAFSFSSYSWRRGGVAEPAVGMAAPEVPPSCSSLSSTPDVLHGLFLSLSLELISLSSVTLLIRRFVNLAGDDC